MNNQLYGPTGSFGGNGVQLPAHYNVPKGSPFYYGKQESLLNKNDNSTRINNFMSYNFPSPYQNPASNYGVGPQITNAIQEISSAPNKNDLFKSPVLRQPTKNNPMMNVMPMDYDSPQVFDDYVRYEKSTYPGDSDFETRHLLKDDFEKGLFMDADSLLWNRLNSQRQFFSAPVGSVPNNQNEFANWLYGSKTNCKVGSIYQGYGVQYTDDSLLCNGFNVSTPTNKGLLDGSLMSSVWGGGS